MKTILVKFLAAAVSAVALNAPAQNTASPPAPAQQKIATIDLKRVFDEFYKTKIISEEINQDSSKALSELKEIDEARQKAIEEYKKAVEDANNQAISPQEREKRVKAKDAKLIQVNEIEQQFKQQDRIHRSTLEEKQFRAREKLFKEIQAVAHAKARAAGYTMVIDSAAETINRTPVVFFSNGTDDLTVSVLKELNAKAPPDLPKSDKNGKSGVPDNNGLKEEKK